MFFGSKKRRQSTHDASQPSDSAANEVEERQSRLWRAWRRSAQKVTRTWNEWLAADSRDDAEFYRRYTSALDHEERAAAEIEGMLNREGSGQDLSDCVATPGRPITNH